jgi:hypothetical protein
MVRILPATWNVDFALVDEREKNRMQGKIKWTRWCDFKVAIGCWWDVNREYIQIEGEEITKLELSTNELVDVALGISYAQALILILICI